MEELAQVYSEALFQVARDDGKLDEIRAELGAFTDALAKDHQLQVFFFSPYFSSREQREGLGRVLSGADPAFFNFLQTLVDKHRMPVLFRIRRQFEHLYEREERLLPVVVTSAIELDQKTLEAIGKKIELQTKRKVLLESKVDDDILGGLVVRVGNMILDASIRNQLERLRKQVAKAA